jgi:hypothetical protein
MDGTVLGLDWGLALGLCEDAGVPRAAATALLPAIEAGMMDGLHPPDEEGSEP